MPLPPAVAASPFAAVLPGMVQGSDFLRGILVSESALLARLADAGPDQAGEAVLAGVSQIGIEDRPALMRGLRRARRQAALLAALADLAGLWSLEQVTGFLSAFADAAINRVVEHLVAGAVARGELAAGTTARTSGLVVLGMGKLGALELNYSSDVDLIVLFDEKRMPFRAGREPPLALAVRTARSLEQILEQPTAEGHVARIDLRLRPHLPGHPLALSTEAALLYYERHGQNWERAALIKARPVAGDFGAGAAFLAELRGFVWRRSLDYAAIQDIASIKRQINAQHGSNTIAVAGHDLKLGRGGIREIEFFAQVQQLVLGGRDPALRAPGTLPALRALAGAGWIRPEVTAELGAAYRVLRALEHRLQMVADRQTHTLPADQQELGRFAAFAGLRPEELTTLVTTTLATVERHWAALFEHAQDLAAGRRLVFTGTDDDPGTLQTLGELGFARPAEVAARIRAWHHGHIRATRSPRGRELLTELLPGILQALARDGPADEGFARFDEFVSALPAGVPIFSLLRANPGLLDLLARLIGAAPVLARRLAARVDLFEAMLEPGFLAPAPALPGLEAELTSRLADDRGLEDALEACRRWAHGRQLQAGLQLLLGSADPGGVARDLTAIAEAVLRMLLPRVEAWLAAQHGRLPGGSFVVLGLGALGARALTAGSDLDLVFLYDAPEGAVSDGPRPLAAATYYARLSSRLVTALSAPTAGGRLFAIDTRLRPSGNAGPVAVSLANFAAYQARTAELWEHQALCRARVVAGDVGLARSVQAVITATLRRPRDPIAVGRAIRAMRLRVLKEHGAADVWQLKHCRGGLVELEFLAQFLVLAHGDADPSLVQPETGPVLAEAARLGLLGSPEAAPDGDGQPERDQARPLLAALDLVRALHMLLRLGENDRLDLSAVPAARAQALVDLAHRVDPQGAHTTLAGVEARLRDRQAQVRQAFDRLCPPDDPA